MSVASFRYFPPLRELSPSAAPFSRGKSFQKLLVELVWLKYTYSSLMRALPLYLMPFPLSSSNSSCEAIFNKLSLAITLTLLIRSCLLYRRNERHGLLGLFSQKPRSPRPIPPSPGNNTPPGNISQVLYSQKPRSPRPILPKATLSW